MRLAFWRDHSPPRPSEATRARQQAERDLAAAKAETPKYAALAHSLIEIQRRNHLGESAARILRGEQ